MSANTVLYYQRKSQGVCVRCAGPRSGTSVLCELHLNWQRSQRKQKCPDDAPWAIPAEPEPKRDKYQAESPVLPPLPTECPRCTHQLIPCEMEIEYTYVPAVRCWCCGYLTDRQMLANRLTLVEEPGRKNEHHKTGPQLPEVIEA